MKNNNLFRKFLALFLTGTMLAGVGCKDYDDDIDDINKKIDDLNAKVELKADASALQTISDKLKDVDFSKFVTDAELSQELAAYVKDADLKKKVGDLGFQTVTQVQDLIKGLQNEAQVKALIENQLKAADLWSKIGGEVKKGILEELAKNSELTTAVKNQAVAAVLAAITNDPAVKDIKTAISKIAGEEASEFVKEYMDVNNKAWIENVNSAAAEAVKNAESALSRQIISLISTQGYLKKSDLTAELGAFKQAIAQLQADVTALINRIQSLVNVPGTMYVGSGGSYTTMDFYKVGATPIGNGMVTLTYRVTPASLAKDLVDAYANGKATFAIVSEQIKTRAATATPAATITDVRFIEEGKFAVTATMSAEELGELYEKEEKWITLALSIENTVNPGTGAEDETASEVTNNVLSNFASIMPDEAQEIELGVYTKDAAAGFARRRQDPDDAGQRQQTAWLENQHRRLHRNAQILRRPQPVGRDYGQNRDRQIHPARRQLETRLRHETRYGGLPCSRRFRRRRQERRMRTQNRDQRRRESHDGNDRGAADLHHHQPGRRDLHLQGDSQTAGMELCVRQERHRRADRHSGNLR